MSNHTKGPWEYLPANELDCGAIATKTSWICDFVEDPTPENARLIAAAPELLLFAEQCAGIFNGYEIYHTNKGDETKAARNRCYKDMAESVIRKAKGKAND